MRRMLLLFGLVVTLTACGEGTSIGRTPVDEAVNRGDFRTALDYLRERLRSDPDDPETLEAYYSTVEQAETYYLDRARGFRVAGNFERAEGELGRGIVVIPESTILRAGLARVAEARDARRLYRDARVAARLGRNDRAIELAEDAVTKDPEYAAATSLLQTLYATRPQSDDIRPIRLQTGAPVTINFQDARFKDAVLALGRAYGVNMIFDADLSDREISVFAEQVEFSQAFALLLKSNNAFYRRLGQNSVIIAQDSPAKRAEYEDYRVRTFFVRSGNAQSIADALTLTLGLQTVTVNEDENSITVRDTPDRLLLADQLVNTQDRTPAEVVMEVEVLEVNRTKSEQLGLDFGSELSITPPALTASDIFPVNEIDAALGASAVVLPAATFRFFKQDVDARTLASPRIRALNGREAKFHVGDEVPLRASEIIEDTGQTRTIFEYREVGIRLTVTPEVRLNSSVTIDLDLEVSTLGQNLGTTDNPAFVIGTRNVQTRMQLDDGETAIIGGLIKEEDRNTVQSVPGVGRIPALGRIFRSNDGEGNRTDIILTLTPRVVRPRDLPGLAEADFFSGTGTRVSSTNPNDFIAGPVRGNTPVIRLDLSGSVPAAAGRIPIPSAAQGTAPVAARDAEPVISFQRNAYDATVGETFDVIITAAGFPSSTSGTAIVRYRPELVRADSVDTPLNLPVQIDNERGEIRIDLTGQVSGLATREIAAINFTAQAEGLSYLIFGNAVGAGGAQNLPANTALRNSRIAIR